jgi:hypothetical protein
MALVSVNNGPAVPVADDHNEVVRQLTMAFDSQTAAVFRRSDGQGSLVLTAHAGAVSVGEDGT